MSKLNKILAVLLVVAIVAAVVPANVAFAAKGGEKGKPSETVKGDGGDKGNVSNGSGDKKGPGESNGKNQARPDQDGKGADHGADNDDKAWDGNNGCGNDKDDPDSPWEDDNNGKCKGLHKDGDSEDEIAEEDDDSRGDSSLHTDDGYEDGGDEDEPDEGTHTSTTVRVCFHSRGNAVEVAEVEAEDILGFVVEAGGAAFEATVITEGWHKACWDAVPGAVYYVLAWNGKSGHGGPVYRVEVTEDATGLVEIYNPFEGTIVVDGVVVTRMNPGRDLGRIQIPL